VRASSTAAPAPADDPLAEWCQACARGDHSSFLRRLAWDGIDLGVASAAVSTAMPDGFPGADWVTRLPAIEAAAAAAAAAVGSPSWEDDVQRSGPELPFVDVWLPVVRLARQELRTAAPLWSASLSEDAVSTLERHLLASICRVSELALLAMFRDQAVTQEAGPSGAYLRFVRSLLASGTSPLLAAHPVLARQVVRLIGQWQVTTLEFTRSLARDRDAIQATFDGAAGQVHALRPGLSDRHDDGRQVMRVAFTSGLTLAYKPRDVRIEGVYNDCLEWLRRAGLPAAPPALRALARDSHGWIEWVEPGTDWSPADARHYFRTAGALACVAYALGGADLHSENLVATARGPVLVDTEMLLQPSTRPGLVTDGGDESPLAAGVDSCLTSGLVSAVVIDRTGAGFDVGGLRPVVERHLATPARRWRHLRTDRITFEPVSRVRPLLHNDVLVNGEVQRPDDYADQLCAGFDEAYRFLESRREALLSPDGPLAAFAECPVRVLFRPSDQYAVAQYVMASPRYQRSGIARSMAVELLHRVFVAETDRPTLWPLVHDERVALERLDIPRVTLAASATSLVASSGRQVQGYFHRSGLDEVRRRVASLGIGALDRHIDLLRAALGRGVASALPGPRASSPEETLVAAAERLAAVVLARAVRRADGRLEWPSSDGRDDLYGGSSGVGVFFAALAAVTGDEGWRATASLILRPLAAPAAAGSPQAPRLGACTGRPSVAYGLSLAGWLLGDDDLGGAAQRIGCGITLDVIDADTVLDIEGGAAGALAALLAIHQRWPADRLMTLARRCAERLVATQIRSGEQHGAWLAGDRPLARPGFAHGAAGIAAALSRWADHTGDTGVHGAVRDAWAFERRVAAANSGTYPTVRSDGARVQMVAWCHGAAGVALGRALAPAALVDPHLARERAAAVQQTLAAPASQLDHLCCGNLGRADVALTAGLATGTSAWVDAGRGVANAVAARVLAPERHGMRGRGFQRGAAAPELFQGLAGIGYQLLRTAHPGRLPSLLALESLPVGPMARPGQDVSS